MPLHTSYQVWAFFEMRPDVAVARLFTDAHEALPAAPDLVGFSFSWELDYTNIMTTLADLGVPMLAEDRGDDDPLVRWSFQGLRCSALRPCPGWLPGAPLRGCPVAVCADVNSAD